ncbi:MAG TPA: 6-phosphogluconolactonase [Acidobacteriota bacterium]|nr:6-phosphogluconolactonase [Acidobacteriota bacterium]
MPLKVIIAADFDHMSEIASELAVEDIREKLRTKKSYILGLATGNTPTGMYKYLARAANDGAVDSSAIVSFNLDEYVGLPGENAQQRALHKESYCFFMIQELFGLLRRKFRETNVPCGTLINQSRFEAEIESNPEDVTIQGKDRGKAVVIRPDARSDYLRWIRTAILDRYAEKIEGSGGIDLHVIGVGGRGHVGFHEAGIPFENNPMLLVKLDDNTIANAVSDGHFNGASESPLYAVSMGAELIFRARTVLLVANGARKAETLADALMMEPDCSVPISYGHLFSRRGGRMIYVIDRPAAAGVLANRDAIAGRGIEIDDRSAQTARIPVSDLKFSRDPQTGLMV